MNSDRQESDQKHYGVYRFTNACGRLQCVYTEDESVFQYGDVQREFFIYAGLLFYWIQSVRTRLLPTRARSYAIAAASLMLFYLTLRVFKYRVAGLEPVANRYAVYAYWIPQVMAPALFLMTCVRIRAVSMKNLNLMNVCF